MRIFKNCKFEFSKIVVSLFVLSYFIVLILGIYVVLKILENYPEYSVQALCSLFGYASITTPVVVSFYINKAKAENIHKYPNIENDIDVQDQNNINTIQTDDVIQSNISDK